MLGERNRWPSWRQVPRRRPPVMPAGGRHCSSEALMFCKKSPSSCRKHRHQNGSRRTENSASGPQFRGIDPPPAGPARSPSGQLAGAGNTPSDQLKMSGAASLAADRPTPIYVSLPCAHCCRPARDDDVRSRQRCVDGTASLRVPAAKCDGRRAGGGARQGRWNV